MLLLDLNGATTFQDHCSAKVYIGSIELERLADSIVWLTSMTCHHSHHANLERSGISIARQERYPNGDGNAIFQR